MWRVREPVQNVLNADGKWRILLFDNELSTSLFGDGRDYNRTILSDIFNENSKTIRNPSGGRAKIQYNQEVYKMLLERYGER